MNKTTFQIFSNSKSLILLNDCWGELLGGVDSKSPHTVWQCDMRMKHVNLILFLSYRNQIVREKPMVMSWNQSVPKQNEDYFLFLNVRKIELEWIVFYKFQWKSWQVCRHFTGQREQNSSPSSLLNHYVLSPVLDFAIHKIRVECSLDLP